jgi:hypothetical protein
LSTLALRRSPTLAFALGAAAVILGSRAVLASRTFAGHPDPLATAVTLDLTLVLGALFWATLVRARKAPPATVAAAVLCGLAVAGSLLPPPGVGHHPRWVAASAACLEVLLAARIALAARRIARLLPAAGAVPFEEAFRAAARKALGPYPIVDLLAAETAFLHMCFFAWRARPHLPPGARPVTVHRTAGFGAVAFALALAGVGETIGLHLLVALVSARAAWVLTGLAIYGLVWLVGEWRALGLRPMLLHEGALEVRVGLRLRGVVPLDAIRAVCLGSDARAHRGAVVASPVGSPNLYLHLDREIGLAGPLGRLRRGVCLGLRVDEPEALAAALRARAHPPW